MDYIPVKIDSFRHEKMKQLAGTNHKTIVDEYRDAIDYYISHKTKEIMLQDTGLENYFNDKLNRMENHLASMLARTGMDTSMNLMGMILFLEKFFNEKYTREQLQEQLRKDGARYFATAIKKDKEEKKEGAK